MIEAMKPAYADRAEFLGDPDVVKVPVAGLTSKRYAATLRAAIDPASARRRRARSSPAIPPLEGDNTTHFSVVDRDGNAVANTYTLNFTYGLGLVADGTGILLNNELDDFAAKPGAPNAYGLVGGDANAPGPGKRPLSSMAPTIVLKDGSLPRHRLARRQPHHHHGAAGDPQRDRSRDEHRGSGRRAAHPSPVAAGRGAPSAGFSPDTIRLLEARGHKIVVGRDLRLGQLDPGDARRPHRRRRPAPARHAGGGVLNGRARSWRF